MSAKLDKRPANKINNRASSHAVSRISICRKISETKIFEIQNGLSLNIKPKFSSKAQSDSIMYVICRMSQNPSGQRKQGARLLPSSRLAAPALLFCGRLTGRYFQKTLSLEMYAYFIICLRYCIISMDAMLRVLVGLQLEELCTSHLITCV